jgi:hypothetical protein
MTFSFRLREQNQCMSLAISALLAVEFILRDAPKIAPIRISHCTTRKINNATQNSSIADRK